MVPDHVVIWEWLAFAIRWTHVSENDHVFHHDIVFIPGGGEGPFDFGDKILTSRIPKQKPKPTYVPM